MVEQDMKTPVVLPPRCYRPKATPLLKKHRQHRHKYDNPVLSMKDFEKGTIST